VHDGRRLLIEAHPMSTTIFLEVALRDDAADVEEIIRETLAQTTAFPGCESLEVLIDDADPTKYIVVEKWATTADHDSYIAWRGTPEGRSRLGEILAAPPVTRQFEKTVAL
ncbi:MAG: hypothetical protein JWP75_591, partial [Frondihabitans sp.]|nr:hypothetical protein [Frondihabitans sp.]